MRTRIIVGAAVGVSILVAGVAMAWHRMHQDPPAAFPTGTTEAQTQYWEGRIRAIGPAAAYDEFTREVTPLDPALNTGMHTFSEQRCTRRKD